MTNDIGKRSLIDHFSALDEPRQAWKVEYPLAEIMLLVLCATLAGADSFVIFASGGARSSIFCAPCCRSRRASRRMTRSTT